MEEVVLLTDTRSTMVMGQEGERPAEKFKGIPAGSSGYCSRKKFGVRRLDWWARLLSISPEADVIVNPPKNDQEKSTWLGKQK